MECKRGRRETGEGQGSKQRKREYHDLGIMDKLIPELDRKKKAEVKGRIEEKKKIRTGCCAKYLKSCNFLLQDNGGDETTFSAVDKERVCW